MLRLMTSILLLLPLAAGGQAPPPWLDLPPRPERAYPEITVSAEKLAAGGFVPFDARPEVAAGALFLPGAVRADLGRCSALDPGCLRAVLSTAGISGETPLAVHGETIDDVALAFLRLEAAGCRNVRLLDGGMAAWRQAGKLLVKEAARLPARPFENLSPRGVSISAGEVLGRLGDPGFELIDLRDRGDWTRNAYEAPEAFRAGHLPRSLPWDPRGALTAEGRLPEARGAREAFERLGPRAGEILPRQAEIVLYGKDDGDPAVPLAYLLLRVMGYEPRVLAGSFAGWRREGRPVVRIVEAAEARSVLAGREALALDLRESIDFGQGHLPGAVLLTLPQRSRLTATVLAARPGFDRDADPLVLYCYGRDCIRSWETSALAARDGFAHILWFREGMTAWQEAGYPVETGGGAVR